MSFNGTNLHKFNFDYGKMNSIILINKPNGVSSFSVVASLRRIFGVKKVGHTGTLDPMATGVLPVFVGSATKAIPYLDKNKIKVYKATIKFGIETDTLDITGRVLKENKSNVVKEELLNVLKTFEGENFQEVPMYSAVKIKGKKLYEIARKGEKVKTPIRKVFFYEIKLLDFSKEDQTAVIKVSCSRGTYIRQLCKDIGVKINELSCLSKLCRLESDGFLLENCISVEQVEKCSLEKKHIEKSFLQVDEVFNYFNSIKLTKKQTELFKNGVKLDILDININNDIKEKILSGDIIKVYNYNNILLSLAYVKDKSFLKSKCFFRYS